MKPNRTIKLMSKVKPKLKITFTFTKAEMNFFHDVCPYCKTPSNLYMIKATRKHKVISGNATSHFIGKGDNWSPIFCNRCINAVLEDRDTFHFKAILGLL